MLKEDGEFGRDDRQKNFVSWKQIAIINVHIHIYQHIGVEKELKKSPLEYSDAGIVL